MSKFIKLNDFCFESRGKLLLVFITILSILSIGFVDSYANETQSRLKANKVQLKFKKDRAAAARLKSWRNLMKDKRPRKISVLLKEVNDFFNRLHYVSDSQLNQKADVWMTPYEFLADGGGDCEDFAIAKYFTLVIMGVPENRLRITYVTIPTRGLAHMVLTYYPTPDSEPFILDNLTNEILPASQRSDLVPVYSFNRGKSWLQDRMGKSREYGRPSDLSKWRNLLRRFKMEEDN
ncbi:MAG: transglutaminase-like cysteine peptidase [Legionellaceae bacterium]|nr:transglutaminase-like cysteine peptidase [Legionellaceae bacterium]